MKQADVSGKPMVRREAIATGFIKLKPETVRRIREGRVEKGDPLQVARLGGINAAKFTPLLLPLCHQLKIDNVSIETRLMDDGVEVVARVKAFERTGVEMEALTAASIALLNIWDAVKAYEKDERGQYPETEITGIRVLEKLKEG
ncbi:MAG: cyclic pyranopterin monophosphate synthase MoaC [Candidatus Wolframiiraptor sp. EX4484-121]|nr:MAG: cyclic pyranopterin monophosphate synthase MoaC [Candidatus Wolframiiraptor sp. EX4484-121]